MSSRTYAVRPHHVLATVRHHHTGGDLVPVIVVHEDTDADRIGGARAGGADTH